MPMLYLEPEMLRDFMTRAVINKVATAEPESSDMELKILVNVVTSTEDGHDIMQSMRSVHPATCVSEIREA